MMIDQIKKLREETGVSLMKCKKALEEANGDLEKAKKILREEGEEVVKSKTLRTAEQGIIEGYVHSNKKIGSMVEIRCESDFVARSSEFCQLAHEICLQIAAAKPLFLKEEEIPLEFLDGERKIYQKQFENSGKPQKIIDQIIEGKLAKYKKEITLLSQPWIKDESKTISDLINDCITKLGEKIEVKKFSRFEI